MRKELTVNLCIWTVFLSLKFSVTYILYPSSLHIWIELMFHALVAGVIYTVALYILPNSLPRKSYKLLTAALFISLILFVAADYLIEGVLEVMLYDTPAFHIYSAEFIVPSIKFFFQYCAIGVGYYYVKQFYAERASKLEMENAYLRSQINPHFLFNTLSHFSYAVGDVMPDLIPHFRLLGDVLRYPLKKPEADGKVSLVDEIEHIDNIIGLYHLRYEAQLQVRFTRQGDLNGIRIIPQVLSTLVENAFKHGEKTIEHHPLEINLHIVPGCLTFTVRNWKKKTGTEEGHAVGLTNIKRRLDIAYPGSHTIEVKEDDDIYFVTLKIHIKA